MQGRTLPRSPSSAANTRNHPGGKQQHAGWFRSRHQQEVGRLYFAAPAPSAGEREVEKHLRQKSFAVLLVGKIEVSKESGIDVFHLHTALNAAFVSFSVERHIGQRALLVPQEFRSLFAVKYALKQEAVRITGKAGQTPEDLNQPSVGKKGGLHLGLGIEAAAADTTAGNQVEIAADNGKRLEAGELLHVQDGGAGDGKLITEAWVIANPSSRTVREEIKLPARGQGIGQS